MVWIVAVEVKNELRNVLIRPAVIGLVIAAVLARYPCVKDINVISISKQKQIWTVTGTITVNPQEIPEELCYNRDPNGFIPWWEKHINEVLDLQKIPVQVLKLELWFVSTSETVDVIGFCVEFKIGSVNVIN